MKDRTVLVVGGAGYVGSVLVARLLSAGAQVRVLDNLIYDNGFSLQHLLDDERVTFQRGDLRDHRVFERAAQGATDVVLLAALVGDPICKKYPELATSINVDGARGILDRLDGLGVERFVFTSTCSNYGIHDPNRLADETSTLNPQSLYAQTKVDVEQSVLERSRGADCAMTVLRIATAYGMSARMRFDLTVSQFVRELASGKSLLVYDADTWRPYCHVADISKAIMTVLQAAPSLVDSEVFNVGDEGQQFTKRMIVEEATKHLEQVDVAYRSGDTDPRNYRVGFSKIADRLGFTCDRSVQSYVPMLTTAVQAGVFAGADEQRFGNYEVRVV